MGPHPQEHPAEAGQPGCEWGAEREPSQRSPDLGGEQLLSRPTATLTEEPGGTRVLSNEAAEHTSALLVRTHRTSSESPGDPVYPCNV